MLTFSVQNPFWHSEIFRPGRTRKKKIPVQKKGFPFRNGLFGSKWSISVILAHFCSKPFSGSKAFFTAQNLFGIQTYFGPAGLAKKILNRKRVLNAKSFLKEKDSGSKKKRKRLISGRAVYASHPAGRTVRVRSWQVPACAEETFGWSVVPGGPPSVDHF